MYKENQWNVNSTDVCVYKLLSMGKNVMEIFAAQNKLPLHPYSAMLCLSTTVMPDAIPLVLPVKVLFFF